MANGNVIPPLPPGFTLDPSQAAEGVPTGIEQPVTLPQTGQENLAMLPPEQQEIPPLPPGFTLDQPQAPPVQPQVSDVPLTEEQEAQARAQANALDIPGGETPQELTPEEQQAVLQQGESILASVGGTLGGLALELASGLGRQSAAILDQAPGIFNSLSKLVGSEFRVPGFTQLTSQKPAGAFTEPGLLQDIVVGTAETIPGALAGGAGVRQLAQKVTPLIQSGAEPVLAGLSRQIAAVGPAVTAAQDVVGTALSSAGQVFGKELAGETGAIIGGLTLPLATALPAIIKSGVTGFKNFLQAQPGADQEAIIQAGKREGVRILTSDVVPPETFIGQWTKDLGEKLGFLGTGTIRKEQQIARQNTVEKLIDDYGVSIDSPFAGEIVASVNAKTARRLVEAQEVQNEARDILNQFGPVPPTKTRQAVDDQIRLEQKVREKQDPRLIRELEKTQDSVEGAPDFDSLAAIRTRVIDDLLEARADVKPRVEATWQAVKSSIDQDMARFSRITGTEGREAGKKWRAANRNIAKEIDAQKVNDVSRVLRTGNARPDTIMPILTSARRDILKELKRNTGKKGQAAVKSAIIQDALKSSGFVGGSGPSDINPTTFTNAMKKPRVQQVVDIFFNETDNKITNGIVRMLDATKAAQAAKVVTQTGQLVVPIAAAGGAGALGVFTDPLAGLAAGSLIASTRAYESKAFRSLMLKLDNTKKGSKEESKALDRILPGVFSLLQRPSLIEELTPTGEPQPQAATQ